MSLDLKGALLLTPEQVAEMFGEDRRWVYRNARPGGQLARYVRRLGKKQLYFHRESIERFIEGEAKQLQ